MTSEIDRRPRSIRVSLRAKAALGLALPLLIVLVGLSLVTYHQRRHDAETQLEMTMEQVGGVIMSSLHHAMLYHDHAMLEQALMDLTQTGAAQRVRVVNLDNTIKADSQPENIGAVSRTSEPGCVECHSFPPAQRPRAVRVAQPAGTLRIVIPIRRDPECAGCHTQNASYLGIVVTDVSVAALDDRLSRSLRTSLILSVISTALVSLGLYLLVHRLVVRPVETLHVSLGRLATGDLTVRVPLRRIVHDELGDLALDVNRVAGHLEAHEREREERAVLREQAIITERERIARELHDGVAQLLSYVSTKAMATRLLLARRSLEAAADNVRQLEEAARSATIDIRAAIVGLRLAGQADVSLAALLRDYAAQFTRLTGLDVEVTAGPEVDELALPAEAELQLLRIVQEALANVRKHAQAGRVAVGLDSSDGCLQLSIEDDGRGFDCGEPCADDLSHFGLSTMRERAEAIGASYDLQAAPGCGTRITLRLAAVPAGEGATPAYGPEVSEGG